MFAVVFAAASLLVHPVASQKAPGNGGKGGLGALGGLLGGLIPGGFEVPPLTGPMYPAEYLKLPGTGKYPAVSYTVERDGESNKANSIGSRILVFQNIPFMRQRSDQVCYFMPLPILICFCQKPKQLEID
jgi:hypothetical protein